MTSPLLTVVIPCYNEARNIPLLLARFAEKLDRPDVELLLVNNGSQDDSAAVLADTLPQYPFARTVHVPVNQGYGYGILSGLANTTAPYIGWTHADMQTDPYDLIRALQILEKANWPADLYVKGNRKGRPLFDDVFTMGMSLYETVYLGAPLWDINAQPNIFHRSFYERWDNPPHDFSLDLYAYYMAHHLRLRLQRFPVRFPERIHGTSSWNTGLAAKKKFIRRTLLFSKELKQRLHD
jgi:glycosyltransferase involved in cell wall biosynthesis